MIKILTKETILKTKTLTADKDKKKPEVTKPECLTCGIGAAFDPVKCGIVPKNR